MHHTNLERGCVQVLQNPVVQVVVDHVNGRWYGIQCLHTVRNIHEGSKQLVEPAKRKSVG